MFVVVSYCITKPFVC